MERQRKLVASKAKLDKIELRGCLKSLNNYLVASRTRRNNKGFKLVIETTDFSDFIVVLLFGFGSLNVATVREIF